jgi:solute carrier family 35, member F3/4
MNLKKLLFMGFFFCCLWIVANYCYVAALSRVNSSAVMAIFSSNYAFVYLLSLYFLKDQIHLLPFLSLLLSISGILLLSLSSSIVPSLLPLFLTLISSFSAALYKVLLKLCIPTASLMTISSFLGFIGLINCLFFWGFWLGFENVRQVPWRSLIFSGIIGLFYNSLINFGIVYTYPMFIAVGVGLAMPGNMIWDVLGNGLIMENQQIIGSVMILVGFGCILLEGYRNAVREAEKRRKQRLLEESSKNYGFRETTSPT